VPKGGAEHELLDNTHKMLKTDREMSYFVVDINEVMSRKTLSTYKHIENIQY
jgi:hypothetical protein